jgi:glycosyltransferase involved in cell wall biosynthesis
MPSPRKLVSIVAPFYNEEEAVEPFYRGLSDVLEGIAYTGFEIICIDDGSYDDTLPRLISLVDRDPRFIVIELSRNFGKEAALTAGLDAAKGDAVIPIDADLQDPPELIPALIAAWQKEAEVVLARRCDRDSDTFLKRNTAKLFYRLHNWLSQVQIPPDVGDFRLIDKSVLEALKQQTTAFHERPFCLAGLQDGVNRVHERTPQGRVDEIFVVVAVGPLARGFDQLQHRAIEAVLLRRRPDGNPDSFLCRFHHIANFGAGD